MNLAGSDRGGIMTDEDWAFIWWILAVAAIVWAVYAWSSELAPPHPLSRCEAGITANMHGHLVCSPVGTDGKPPRY